MIENKVLLLGNLNIGNNVTILDNSRLNFFYEHTSCSSIILTTLVGCGHFILFSASKQLYEMHVI